MAMAIGRTSGFARISSTWSIIGSPFFPHSLGFVVGLVAGAGSTGCFVIPWLTGALGDQAGIAFAMKWLGVWALAIAVGGALIRRDRARELADRVS